MHTHSLLVGLLGIALTAGCRNPENQVIPQEDAQGLSGCDLSTAPTWYGDADGDGFGADTFTAVACESPGDSWVDNNDDCDDLNATTNPSADEVCDEVDNNCNASVDEDAVDRLEWFVDEDGDGFGGETMILACSEPEGAIEDSGDCDDANAAVNPEAVEVCNDGIDNDCDAAPVPCQQRANGAALVLTGATEGARAGASGGMVGDLNGDGIDDLLMNAFGDNSGGTDAGASYVFYGPVTDRGALGLASADVAVIAEEDVRLGIDFAGAGDLDGDGLGDLVLGGMRSSGPHNKNGTTFILHGPVLDDVDLSLDDATVSRIEGEDPWDRAGYAVRILGDFDGDNIDDLAIGAPFHKETSTLANSGAVYLVSGGFAPGSTIDLESAMARYDGSTASETIGQTLGSADLNGDGQGDLLVGVATSLTAEGVAHVIWGTEAPQGGALADEDAISGDASGQLFGSSVDGVGDVNGDGYEDMLVGATGHDTESDTNAGAVYLFHGDASGLVATRPDDAQAVLLGIESDGRFGASVAGGDWDGDGGRDLLIGADLAGPLGEGMAWLVLDGDLTGSQPIDEVAHATVLGELAGDGLGGFVGFADADSDGDEDLLLGATNNDTDGSDAGRGYLIFDIGL